MNSRNQVNTYSSYPHTCSYLPNRLAITSFIDPNFPKTASLYDKLAQQGFRRSGDILYRPKCKECQECISVRLLVEKFTPRRSQRRIWKKNQDLTVSMVAPVFQLEHFNLYCRYVAARHQNDEKDEATPQEYLQFLTSDWSRTVFYEFRLQKQLLSIAVVDYVENGLSAVYTFFDPDYPARSLGVYAVLWQIEEAKRLNFSFLYLGYWVKDCRKMSYKTDYQPLEYYIEERWQQLNN
ncbi:arginyltransferase [Candidatus Parabeggiatoa sp. HSG14]|uniref:arginyltransferase n=1 Tax=Candidatus Parabeggiatoa sp. HSG14 TaxID=3055593 RepID=UPI0025A8B193|nr:arginyltransferase [Thiotrichales bacterium HSG14]